MSLSARGGNLKLSHLISTHFRPRTIGRTQVQRSHQFLPIHYAWSHVLLLNVPAFGWLYIRSFSAFCSVSLARPFLLSEMGNTKSIRTLPIPPGPYSVGFSDIIQGYGLDGVFLRLYYPIQKCDLLMHASQLRPWAPKLEYIDGYAIYAKVPPSALRVFFSYGIGQIFTPALQHAPVIAPNIVDRFPVLLFTHGLGANRSVYSTVCCDMASQGFVVAALEHRDGSASYTYTLKETEGGSGQIIEVPVPYRPIAPGEKEFPVRHAQINTRVEECRKAIKLLKAINNGDSIQNLLPDSPDFHDFKGRMDFDRLAIMGHSFGGATVIAAVAAEKQFKAGVVLDGWMFPLHNDLYPTVTPPLIFVNMDAFQWRDNILRMKKLASTTVDRPMYTIRGSVHQNQTDFTFMLKGWIAQKFHATGLIDPILCNNISNDLSLAFLRKQLGLPGQSSVEEVARHYEKWVITGTNVILDEQSSL